MVLKEIIAAHFLIDYGLISIVSVVSVESRNFSVVNACCQEFELFDDTSSLQLYLVLKIYDTLQRFSV